MICTTSPNWMRSFFRTAALMADDLKLLVGYSALNSNALAQARAAIQLPRCRYPVDLALGLDALLPHLAKLKAIARVAQFQTLLDTNAVASSVSTMIGIARTLDQEPVLISKLIRLAILNMAVAALERRLNTAALSDHDMDLLSRSLMEAAKTNQIANGLAGERAMFFPLFRMNLAQMGRLAKTSGDDNPEPSAPPLSGSLSQFFKVTGFFERDLRFYLHAMETNISLAATYPKNVPHITDVEAQIFRTCKNRYYILSGMLLPALETAIIKEANSLAQVRAAQTALSVERFRLQHGTLPNKLDELVPQFLSAVPPDPFDGQPLRYRRLEKGFVIYSIGSDGEDNGGRERPAAAKSTDKTPFDITFTIER